MLTQTTQKNIKHDLKKLQNNHFQASLSNVEFANKSISEFQNWMLVLALAELAFLGTLLSQASENDCVVLIKSSLVILILGMMAFLFGTLMQYKHLLKHARHHLKKSIEVTNYILEVEIL